MKRLYLFLAVAGAILPYAFFTQHFLSQGVGLYTFVAALFVNPAAGGFTADLLFTSVVFWIFMFQQKSRGKGGVAPPPGGPTCTSAVAATANSLSHQGRTG